MSAQEGRVVLQRDSLACVESAQIAIREHLVALAACVVLQIEIPHAATAVGGRIEVRLIPEGADTGTVLDLEWRGTGGALGAACAAVAVR